MMEFWVTWKKVPLQLSYNFIKAKKPTNIRYAIRFRVTTAQYISTCNYAKDYFILQLYMNLFNCLSNG